jgi:anaerobic selenocysteine-containing dehydrogenase
MSGLTRRQLLIGGAAGTVALSLRRLVPAAPVQSPSEALARAATPSVPTDYRGWEDVYRAAWRWDRVVRGTHLRTNCLSACAFDVYVKDGLVWREEQADVYAREAAGLPDYAPRGCQKGNCYSSLMVAPDRLTYPLERVGPRGSGRWRRISWDAALTRVADAILDAIQEGGAETVIYDNGTSNVDWGPSTVGEMRLFGLLGATMLDGFAGTGDLAMGAVQTWGTSFVDGTSDDWFRADTLIFWHCNPAATRIPDAHFATEARYRGATVVTVSPDFSPSAVHASLWINPRPATDAALALCMIRALLERNAVDEAYVREQTDLPFLIRDDTGRFLRQSDMSRNGRDDIFYVMDLRSRRIVEAPGTPGKCERPPRHGAVTRARGRLHTQLRGSHHRHRSPITGPFGRAAGHLAPPADLRHVGVVQVLPRGPVAALADPPLRLAWPAWPHRLRSALLCVPAVRGG